MSGSQEGTGPPGGFGTGGEMSFGRSNPFHLPAEDSEDERALEPTEPDVDEEADSETAPPEGFDTLHES